MQDEGMKYAIKHWKRLNITTMKSINSRSHKYKHGGRVLGWRVWVIVLTIISILVLSRYGNTNNTYTREVSEDDLFMKPVVVVPEPTVEDKIKEYFPRNWKTMIAIAHAESHMSMDAVGYNCMYNGISKACKKEDRSKAWSVDCFILQRNYPGRKTCPEGVTIDMHLKESADLSRVQGLQAWVSFQQGTHKKYLATNN